MRQDSTITLDPGIETDPAGGILARDVTVTYRNGLTALSRASFQIPRGTVTALVGVNAFRREHELDAFLDQPAQPSAPIPLHRVVGDLALQRHLFLPQLLERVLARAVKLRVSGEPKTTMARFR